LTRYIIALEEEIAENCQIVFRVLDRSTLGNGALGVSSTLDKRTVHSSNKEAKGRSTLGSLEHAVLATLDRGLLEKGICPRHIARGS